jgi:rhodanese-related sulfurtransferase
MKIVSETQLVNLIKAGNIVLDVRSPIKYRDFHVQGTINVPDNVFAMRISQYKNKNLYILMETFDKDSMALFQKYCEQLKIIPKFIKLS